MYYLKSFYWSESQVGLVRYSAESNRACGLAGFLAKNL